MLIRNAGMKEILSSRLIIHAFLPSLFISETAIQIKNAGIQEYFLHTARCDLIGF
jgi:hypothetical protein